jgi:hypothetical protein
MMVIFFRASQNCSVHPEMVDFGFQQGPSEFSTAGIARYFED